MGGDLLNNKTRGTKQFEKGKKELVSKRAKEGRVLRLNSGSGKKKMQERNLWQAGNPDKRITQIV